MRMTFPADLPSLALLKAWRLYELIADTNGASSAWKFAMLADKVAIVDQVS